MQRLLCPALIRTGLILIASLCFSLGQSQSTNTNGPVIAALERQIEQLRQGQEQILKDLAEVKLLLKDRALRADFPARLAPPKKVSMSVHGEIYRGQATARVAIMEYSDFNCSFCARYAHEIYPQIDTAFVQTGKVKYFYRDLPAPEHTNSWFKARIARCAGESGKFWEVHDRYFADGSAQTDEDSIKQAVQSGLNASELSACIDSQRYVENIRRSSESAERLGLRGTPAFLIGRMSEDGDFFEPAQTILGLESFAVFQETVNALFTEAKPE